MSTFRPSGVVTMTTDLGHKGPYVATMKGVMLARFPDVGIVDLTHDVLVHWPAEAGFWLRRSYRYFPKGTVHIAVVDPGGRAGREVLVIVHEHHAFVVPDNGLLGHLDPERASVHRFDPRKGPSLGLPEPSATFHGRDIFAPIGADLASGKLSPEGVGPRIHEIVPSWLEEAVAGEREVRGAVITTDNFGNLITNIKRADWDAAGVPDDCHAICCGQQAIGLQQTYENTSPGTATILFGSSDYLEFSLTNKNAAQQLAAKTTTPVILKWSY